MSSLLSFPAALWEPEGRTDFSTAVSPWILVEWKNGQKGGFRLRWLLLAKKSLKTLAHHLVVEDRQVLGRSLSDQQ